MTQQHRPIAGFRVAKPVTRRSRVMNENRSIRVSEIRQLIRELIAHEHHPDQAQVPRTPAVEHGAQSAGEPALPPQRKVFDIGHVDWSKSTLRTISMADADARCRRETLLHFGMDPDL